MPKLFKFVGIIIGILVLLIALVLLLIVLFVNPARLKPILVDQVAKYTHRQLNIAGDLRWTFFPYLGVKVSQLQLSNPPNFKEKTFVEIASATVGVKLLPLLHGQVESSGMWVDGMKLNLIKQSNGEVSWDFAPTKTTDPRLSEQTEAADNSHFSLAISMLNLEVTHAEINYIDQSAKKSYRIKDFSLQAKNINLMQPFPLKVNFALQADHPTFLAQVDLSTEIALNLATQIYTFRNLNLSAALQQNGKKITQVMTGDVLVNLQQQTLSWNNFKGKIANIHARGAVNITHLTTNPLTTGKLHIEPFDLRETFNLLRQKIDNLQIAKNVQGNVKFNASDNAILAEGYFTADTLQAAKLTLHDLAVKTYYKNGVLELTPITAKLYEGNLTAQATVNMKSTVPAFTATANLVHIQAEPLLQDLSDKEQKLKIAGLGNVDLRITTQGAAAKTILQNLNGAGHLNFSRGALLGVDLGYLVDNAYALVQRKTPTAIDHNKTNFGNLTATLVIQHGVVGNQDLLMDSPRFLTHGKGTVDLVEQKIMYTLQTAIKQRADANKDNWMNLYGITIPILITGNLANPAIRLDSGALVETVAKRQIEKVTEHAKEKLQEQIEKQAPAAAKLLNNLLGN